MPSQTLAVLETPQHARERLRRRVASAVSECVSTLPAHVLQLNALLSAHPVDLTAVTRIISSDSEFSKVVSNIASMELFNARSCGVTISQAIVLFGSERLRMLALACAFIKSAGSDLPVADRHRLWNHSFLAAALSERVARQTSYPDSGHAYLAGLLHDIGSLPLLVVTHQEKLAGSFLPADWQDYPAAEREIFGVDHCETGRVIATAWNLAPSIADVMQYHHSPSQAMCDPDLAEIVAAGDRHANLLSPVAAESLGDTVSERMGAVDALLRMCVPALETEEAPYTLPVKRAGSEALQTGQRLN